jgi:transcriptional regulator with XRE-family HTH domain
MQSKELLASTLGDLIIKYRLRQRQPHRNAPWSQEDLAFASETDQAHISRIENNQYRPQYETLARICDALALSQTERAYVLAHAGYPVVRPLPDESAVTALTLKLAPLLETYPYPALLIDEGERHWYMNALVAKLWGPCYGATDQQNCLRFAYGKRSLELLFDQHEPRFHIWKSYFEDFDDVFTRNVALFWRAYRTRPQDPEIGKILTCLKHYPIFLDVWQKIETGDIDTLLVEHGLCAIRNPKLGLFRFHAWRTHVAVDERFIVIHATPVDTRTSRALERLTRSA